MILIAIIVIVDIITTIRLITILVLPRKYLRISPILYRKLKLLNLSMKLPVSIILCLDLGIWMSVLPLLKDIVLEENMDKILLSLLTKSSIVYFKSIIITDNRKNRFENRFKNMKEQLILMMTKEFSTNLNDLV